MVGIGISATAAAHEMGSDEELMREVRSGLQGL
jgi:hypothetical protein